MKAQKKSTRPAEVIGFAFDALAFLLMVWVLLSVCTFAGKGDIIFVPSWNLFRYLLPLFHSVGV